MSYPYMIMNEQGKRSSPTKVFIYVLMLNVEDSSRPAPFFVGQTANLSSRFSNHKYVNWHYVKLERPAKIWIAGSVYKRVADEAVSDLVKRLKTRGYVLIDQEYLDDVTLLPASRTLKDFSSSDLKEYSGSLTSRSSVLEEWCSAWKATIATTNDSPSAHSEIVRDSLKKLLVGQEYKSADCASLSLNIASEYSPETGKARVVFKDVYTASDVKQLKERLNGLRHVWVPERKLEPYAVNTFRLVRKLREQLTTVDHVEQ